jgi:cell division protein FtsW (lipid II flippase)
MVLRYNLSSLGSTAMVLWLLFKRLVQLHTIKMNDLLLIAAIPVTIVVLAFVYQALDYYWMNRSTCRHKWTRWSDPQTDAGHPYQLHICSRCNLYEHRLIK